MLAAIRTMLIVSGLARRALQKPPPSAVRHGIPLLPRGDVFWPDDISPIVAEHFDAKLILTLGQVTGGYLLALAVRRTSPGDVRSAPIDQGAKESRPSHHRRTIVAANTRDQQQGGASFAKASEGILFRTACFAGWWRGLDPRREPTVSGKSTAYAWSHRGLCSTALGHFARRLIITARF